MTPVQNISRYGCPSLIKTTLLLTLFILLSASNLHGQDREITVSQQSITIGKALAEIEAKTDYVFAIGHSDFDMSATVTLSSARLTVRELLDQLLTNTGRTYYVAGEQILIIPKRADTATPIKIVPFNPDSYDDDAFAEDVRRDSLRRAERRLLFPNADTSATIIIKDSVISKTYFEYPSKTISLNRTGSQTGSNPIPLFLKNNNRVAIKVNVLHGAAAQAPNIGIEVALGRKSTIDLYSAYNPWNRNGSYQDNKKLIHFVVRPEYRYWLCQRFGGHYFGANVFYTEYNISQHSLLGLFEKEWQYEGKAIGAGLSYGYHLALHRNWGAEFSIGLGAAFMNYDKYQCVKCGDKEGSYSKTYFGPTQAGVKLVYMINRRRTRR